MSGVQVPHPPGTFGGRPGDPSWSAAFDLVYWYLLRYSGDLQGAAQMFQPLKSYIDFMLSLAAMDPTGLLQWSRTGDWLEQKYPSGNPNYHTPIRENMTSAFSTIVGVRVLADAASALGHTEDATKYAGVLTDQLARWHKTYYNGSRSVAGTYGDGSQAALAYTLFLGAPPTVALKAQTVAQLIAQIRRDNNHPTTGIIATKWLPEALSKAGRSDVVLDIAREKLK